MNNSLLVIPDSGRLWVFPSSGELDDEVVEKISERLSLLLEDWKAHGQTVDGAFEIRDRRFIIVAADAESTDVSGCSIDGLDRGVRAIFRELGVELSDVSNIFFHTRRCPFSLLFIPQ